MTLRTNNPLSRNHIVSTGFSVIVTNRVIGKKLNQSPVPPHCLEQLELLNLIHSIHELNTAPTTSGVPRIDLTIFLAHGKTVQPSGQDHGSLVGLPGSKSWTFSLLAEWTQIIWLSMLWFPHLRSGDKTITSLLKLPWGLNKLWAKLRTVPGTQ